jgi:hypothetical protein
VLIEVIHQSFQNNNIRKTCKLLGISRSSYYECISYKKSQTAKNNQNLEIHIKRIYDDSKGIYGATKIHKKLLAEGHKVSLKCTRK